MLNVPFLALVMIADQNVKDINAHPVVKAKIVVSIVLAIHVRLIALEQVVVNIL